MSLYVQWLNLIKEKADETWLTDSQREAYDAILTRWRLAHFINLHGPAGAGKTFIARLLAKQHDYVYVHDLQEAAEGAAQVIVDDAEYTRMMRPMARELHLGRIMLITRRPISEAMPKVELTLSAKDVAQFQVILSSCCGIALIETVPKGQDLAAIIQQEIVARGESHVHQRS